MLIRCPTLMLLGAALLAAPPLLAGDLCPGQNSPAFPVPEYRLGSRMWTEAFGPALPGLQIPSTRDSTDFVGYSLPGAASGHELFNDIAIVQDYAFVSYNYGFSIWRLDGSHAPDPLRILICDGWEDYETSATESCWHNPVANSSEQWFYTSAIDAVAHPSNPALILIVVAGQPHVGTTFWTFDTTTHQLIQTYQNATASNDSADILVSGSTAWVFAGSGEGVQVYDLTSAAHLSSPCEEGLTCTHLLGSIDSDPWSLPTTLHHNDSLYLAATNSTTSKIWALDPADPLHPTLLHTSSTPLKSPQLFAYDDHPYLAAFRQGSIEVYDLGPCLPTGCSSLGTPRATNTPYPVAPGIPRLTFSYSGTTPFLYYGITGTALHNNAPRGELLLDLTDLSPTGLGVPIPLSPLTDSEGFETYDDVVTCTDGTTGIGYWGDMYPGNSYGLNRLRGVTGLWNGDYFYRIAYTLFDVHVRGVATSPPTPSFTFSPDPPFVGDSVAFTDTSSPAATTWSWTFFGSASPSSSTDPDPVVTWSTPGDKYVQLQACNDAGCDTLLETVTILDPVPNITTLTADPNPAAPGQALLLTGQATGRPTLTWSWSLPGSPQPVTGSAVVWDTTGLQPGEYTVTVTVTNAHGSDTGSLSIALTGGLWIDHWKGDCSTTTCVVPAGTVVTFDLQYQGDPTTFTYDWNADGFPDEISSSPVLSHQFLNDYAIFYPRIEISNSEGAISKLHGLPFWITGGATPPARPSNLSGSSQPQPLAVQLTWLDRSATEEAFVVGRRPAGASWFERIANLPANTTRYLDEDPDLEHETEYEYSILAVSGSLENASLAAPVATPAQPADLFADGFESGDTSAWTP